MRGDGHASQNLRNTFETTILKISFHICSQFNAGSVTEFANPSLIHLRFQKPLVIWKLIINDDHFWNCKSLLLEKW